MPPRRTCCAAWRSGAFEPLLDGTNADRVIKVGDWIVECGSGDALLKRFGQSSGLA